MKKVFLISVISLFFSCSGNKNENKKTIIIEPSFNKHGINRCDAG